MSSLEEQLDNLPDQPGVYYFTRKREGERGRENGKGGSTNTSHPTPDSILYIGKATSLRDRVKSYFRQDVLETRGPKIHKMLDEVEDVEVQTTDSVLEALILESNLIKKHQPPYNTREKDNKSYSYVVVTDEDYPRVYTVRGRQLQVELDPDDFKYIFGPYPSAGQLKKALRIVRKIFPFRGKKDPIKKQSRQRSRLYQQMGLSPNIADGEVTKKDYQNTIQNLRLFFEGKKKTLVKKLEKEMEAAAEAKEFERAEDLKRKLFALEHINDVALIEEEKLRDTGGFRIEAYDIAHLSGSDMVGVMTVVTDGQATKSEYRKFNIRTVKSSNDTAALKEVLERRLKHDEWRYPKLIVVDGGKAQRNAAQAMLDEAGVQIPVVSVVKDKTHTPKDIEADSQPAKEQIKKHDKDILIANSEAHRFAISFHKQKRRKRQFE